LLTYYKRCCINFVVIKTKKKVKKLNSLDRGMKILEILATTKRLMGVTELSEWLNVDKASAYRALATLEDHNFVEQDPVTKKYMLGLKLIELSGVLLSQLEVRTRSRPFLRELCKQTGESAHLTTFVNNTIVYIDREEAPGRISVKTEIGAEALFHCTATGKAVAAFLPEDKIYELIRVKGLTPFTPKTITSPEMLKAHFAMVREHGYAIDDEEFDIGVRCIGAPIRNFKGKVIGSVGISGSIITMTLERLEKYIPIVLETSKKISLIMGYKSE